MLEYGIVALAEVQDNSDLESMQRIFKIVPHYDEMQSLLTDEIHSAQSTAILDPSDFGK